MPSRKFFQSVSLCCIYFCHHSCSTAFAQEFRSVAAVSAMEKYHIAVRQAKSEYLEELEHAARIATQSDKLDEAIEIKKEITAIKSDLRASTKSPLEKLRRSIVGTKYTWNRRNDPDHLSFYRDGKVTTHKRGSTGIWAVVESDVVMMRFANAVFTLKFNKDFSSFRVKALGPIKSSYPGGALMKN